MKTQATSFGFEVLVTYLLPGFIAASSALTVHGMSLNQVRVILEWSAKAEIIASLVMVSAFALFGAGIASIQALLETYVLDKCTTRKLNICSKKFDQQWQYYRATCKTMSIQTTEIVNEWCFTIFSRNGCHVTHEHP